MYKEKVQSFLEENIGECFYELKIWKDFLNKTQKAQSIKNMTDTFNYENQASCVRQKTSGKE